MSTGSTPWYLSATVCPHAARQLRVCGRSRSGTQAEPQAPCFSTLAPTRSRRSGLGESTPPSCCRRMTLHEGQAARTAAGRSCCTRPCRTARAIQDTGVSNRSLPQHEPARSSRARCVASCRVATNRLRGPLSSPDSGGGERWRAASRVWFARAPAWADAGEARWSERGSWHAPRTVRPPKGSVVHNASPTTTSARHRHYRYSEEHSVLHTILTVVYLVQYNECTVLYRYRYSGYTQWH